MRLTLVTPPASEPLTEAEVALDRRLSSAEVAAQPAYLNSLITSARATVEHLVRRQCITAAWVLWLDAFPRRTPDGRRWQEIEIPLPPVRTSPAIVVKYLDEAGVEQTWGSANYVATAPTGSFAGPARISPALDQDYPVTAPLPDAVRVEFSAGYGTDADVPPGLKQAMLQLIGHWYEHREAAIVPGKAEVVALGLDTLLEPFDWSPIAV